MNKLRNVRWGYDGDGMGCGPSCGSDFVELAVENENKEIKFVFLALYEEYGRIDIRDRSTFDCFLYDKDNEYDDQTIGFEWYELEEGWNRKDPMFSVINLGLHMLKQTEEIYHSIDGFHPAMEYDGARAYVKDWMFKDLDTCDIPLFTNKGEWDDDEEEAETEE